MKRGKKPRSAGIPEDTGEKKHIQLRHRPLIWRALSFTLALAFMFMIVPRGGGVLFSVTLKDYVEPEPQPQPQPQPDPEPKPAAQPESRTTEASTTNTKPAPVAIRVVRPLLTFTDTTGKVQLNCFRGGTFTAHLRDGRTVTGRIVLDNESRLCFIGPDNTVMPVGDDGSFTFLVDADTFIFQFSAEDLAALRSCTR